DSGGRLQLFGEVSGIGSISRHDDTNDWILNIFHVFGLQKLNCDQNLVARLGIVEQQLLFEIRSHGDASTVVVQDFWNWTIPACWHLEPDLSARDVVTIQSLWHFNPATQP